MLAPLFVSRWTPSDVIAQLRVTMVICRSSFLRPFPLMWYRYRIWSDIIIANHRNICFFHISLIYRKSIFFPKSIVLLKIFVLSQNSTFSQFPRFTAKENVLSLISIAQRCRLQTPLPLPTRYSDHPVHCLINPAHPMVYIHSHHPILHCYHPSLYLLQCDITRSSSMRCRYRS